MHCKTIALVAALAAALTVSTSALAQNTAAPAAAATSSPAKKELINKILVHQQQGVEILSMQLLQQPVAGLMQSAAMALQQMPADKRDAAAKAIEADIKKFVDTNSPYIKERASKLAPAAVTPVLEERFNEDELKQVLAWLDSPVSRKFGQAAGDMQKALTDKLLADVGPTLDGRFQTLKQSIGKHLGLTPPPEGKPAAAPAKKK